MWIFWLVIAGIFLIIEIWTPDFLLFWIGLGAISAMLVSFLTTNVFIQTAVFVAVSALLIFLTKPLVKKFAKDSPKVETNAFSIIGKTGVVKEEINSDQGQVKVNGEVWSAKTEDNLKLEKGTEVEIVKIDGVKAIVKPLTKV